MQLVGAFSRLIFKGIGNFWAIEPSELINYQKLHSILRHYTQNQIEKASRVKCIITDVDGVLTSGGVTYDSNLVEYKEFNVKDGLIVRFIRNAKILVGAITGRESSIVEHRSKELHFDFLYQNAKNKIPAYQKIQERFDLADKDIAYLGDDILDLPLIIRAGLGVAPADAHNYVQDKADLVTVAKGGQGVFREVADLVLASKGEMEGIMAKYEYLQRTH